MSFQLKVSTGSKLWTLKSCDWKSCGYSIIKGCHRKFNYLQACRWFQFRKDTYFVESFNNTLNVYQDKRIAFRSEQYNVRAFLGTLHWNENVSRECTSISLKADPKAPRRLIGKKNNKKKTFKFRNNIWMGYIKFVYLKRAK